jgi:DNA-binding response OmpR family regulator
MLDDKLAAFDSGADDYLVKPFALREVEARLNALAARRRGRVVDRRLSYESIEYDPAKFSVTVEGKAVHLSRKCLLLLEMLISAPHRVFTRTELERELWGEEHPQSDSLRSHMHMLRRALTDAKGHAPIETVHGVGYRFAVGDGRQA